MLINHDKHRGDINEVDNYHENFFIIICHKQQKEHPFIRLIIFH